MSAGNPILDQLPGWIAEGQLLAAGDEVRLHDRRSPLARHLEQPTVSHGDYVEAVEGSIERPNLGQGNPFIASRQNIVGLEGKRNAPAGAESRECRDAKTNQPCQDVRTETETLLEVLLRK